MNSFQKGSCMLCVFDCANISSKSKLMAEGTVWQQMAGNMDHHRAHTCSSKTC